MFRIYSQPTVGLACAAGATVAWAFLSDAYYAVYCLLMAGFMACYTMFSVETRPATVRRVWPRTLVDLAIVCLAGLIVGILLRGGGQVDVFGIRVSFTRLYTPVLMLTLMIGIRVWMTVRPAHREPCCRSWRTRRRRPSALVACVAILSPRAVGDGVELRAAQLDQPADLVAEQRARRRPAGVLRAEPSAPRGSGRCRSDGCRRCRAASTRTSRRCPGWRSLTIVGAVLWAGFRPLKGWVVFTGVFAWLALGPFVIVAQQLTYVPTPWALLRYLPIIGAARMPTRMTILVMLGLSMLLAMAVHHLRSRSRHPRLLVAAIGALLLFELLPAPRTLYSAEIPAVYRVVAADPRPIRVLSLPFGLRDGLSSRGNYSSSSQFYQTFHEKRLVGGYISRLPGESIERYRRNRTLRVLLRLSEGTPVEPELYERRPAAGAERNLRRLRSATS